MKKNLVLPWPVIASALFVFVFTNLFSYFVFNHIPRVHDEIDYLFQAKIFKSGRLYVPSPCAKESFDFPHMVNNGKWYSQYTPGYPFLLLLGLLIGAPWFINPLLASLSIVLFYFIGKEIYEKNIGILTAVLGAVSIWFLLMSSTMMSHTSGLFFTSLFILFLFRSIKNPSATNGLCSAIGLGMAILIRSYNVILISIPFLIYYSIKLLKNFKARLKNVAVFTLVCLIFIGILLIYNQITNGHPLKMGYYARYGENHGLGFGRTGYLGIPHNPFLGTDKIGKSLKAMNKDLFGWPLSSFLALLPLLWINRTDKEKRGTDILLASGFFLLLLGMFFYWGTHVFIGARMFFESLPLLFLLSAHGIAEIPHLFSAKLKKLDQLKIKKAVAIVLILFTVFAFSYSFPRWIWPSDTEWCYDRFANNFAGVTQKIHNTLSFLQLDQSLVIIKFLYYPFEYFPDGWWSTGFLYDDPYLKEKIIYANDKGIDNIKLFPCFAERKIYLYLGTLEKGMLVPLKKEKNEIAYGEPFSLNQQGYTQLISKPQEFFKIYSPDFGKFLNNLYQQNHFYEIDVVKLRELGSNFIKNRDYVQAAFCYEAALQVEKQPEFRYQLLNLLSTCYLKTGKKAEAKIVLDRITNRNDLKLFKIFPDKGF